MKYNIGDTVWAASVEHYEAHEQCPDCFGKKFLTVILGDDSQVTIDCDTCAPGYEPPRGYIIFNQYKPRFRQIVIDRMEVEQSGIRYQSKCHYMFSQSDVFDTKEEAESRAAEKAKKLSNDEIERLKKKERPAQTWAWNVRYYRREIRHAKKKIEYFTAKLKAAPVEARSK